MKLTNEQIKAILDGADQFEGLAEYYSPGWGYLYFNGDFMYFDGEYWTKLTFMPSNIHSLSDLREILILRQRVQELEQALQGLGYCTDCGSVPEHHLDEPFSSCDCGTGEDYATRPLQRMQTLEKNNQELSATVERLKAQQSEVVARAVEDVINSMLHKVANSYEGDDITNPWCVGANHVFRLFSVEREVIFKQLREQINE